MQKVYRHGVLGLDYKIFLQENKKMLSKSNSDSIRFFSNIQF